MITFRLSADEYERCCQYCRERGLGSISDIIRNGLSLLLQTPEWNAAKHLERRVSDLEKLLHSLLSKCDQATPDVVLHSSHSGPVEDAAQRQVVFSVSSED